MRAPTIPPPADLDASCYLLREAWEARHGRKDARLGIYAKSLCGSCVRFLWRDAMTGESGVLAVVAENNADHVGAALLEQLETLRAHQRTIDAAGAVRKKPKKAIGRAA